MDTNPLAPKSDNPESPEKYIRTFGSDMDIFQKGGTPGLSPLRAPTPAERLVAASPILPEPVAPIVVPTPAPAPAPVVPAPRAEPASAPIETYAEDFRKHMHDTNASTLSVLAAEQDAGPQPGVVAPQVPEKNNRNVWYAAAGVTLLLVGGIGIYLGYSKYLSSQLPVLVAPGVTTPIFVDSREVISGTGVTLVQAINQSVGKPLERNTVRLLSFADSSATTSVFAALKTSAPGVLVRNIDGTQSMAGVVNVNGTASPFFILSVSSYSATFGGMLTWEPSMPNSLVALYPISPAPVAVPVATTTSKTAKPAAPTVATTTPVFTAGFRDEVVSNHDVRVYRDAQNKVVLLYGYWNETTLVIARDQAAFAEILARLATSHP